jgi:hypothetical protein
MFARQRAAAVASLFFVLGLVAMATCRITTGFRNASGIGHSSRTARAIKRVSRMLPGSPGAAKLWSGSVGLFMVVTLRKRSIHGVMRHESQARCRIAELRPREPSRRSESWRPADLRSPVAPSRRESVEGRKQDGRRRSSSATAGDDESCPDGTSARNIACASHTGRRQIRRAHCRFPLPESLAGRRRDARESDRPVGPAR